MYLILLYHNSRWPQWDVAVEREALVVEAAIAGEGEGAWGNKISIRNMNIGSKVRLDSYPGPGYRGKREKCNLMHSAPCSNLRKRKSKNEDCGKDSQHDLGRVRCQ